MVQKYLNTIGDFPQLELGDPTTRSERIRKWRIAIEEVLGGGGQLVLDWWTWCYHTAEELHKTCFTSDVLTREKLYVRDRVPTQ